MVAVINAAATAYAGVIPEDRYHQPYMPLDELRAEIAAGVRFWGLFEAVAVGRPGGPGGPGGRRVEDELAGVMGIQDVEDVTLIRHAYVRPDRQRGGVGTRLLEHLVRLADRAAGKAAAGRHLGSGLVGRGLLRAPRLRPRHPG